MSGKVNLALFASGNGTNVQAIINAVAMGQLEANLCAVVCDEPDAPVIARAKQASIDCLVLSPHDCASRNEWETQLLAFVQERQADLLVLAGFMRIVSHILLDAYPDRIINIHPSLLPNFPGRHGIQDAYDAGVSETGVTIHYVNEAIDSGKIIYQESLAIDPSWNIEELETHIHAIEHRIYPKILQQLIQNLKQQEGSH